MLYMAVGFRNRGTVIRYTCLFPECYKNYKSDGIVCKAVREDSVVDLVTGLGAPLSKLAITAPVQAFRFKLQDRRLTTPGSPALELRSMTRDELCSTMSTGNWTLERDQDQAGPYIFRGDQWIAYEDSTSMDIKAKYAKVRGLAGIALKDASQDGSKCGGSLLQATYSGLSKQNRAPRGAVLKSLEREILETPSKPLASVQLSPYRISRVIDVEGHVHTIRQDTRTEFECTRQGYFVHPQSCGRFYRCVKFDQNSEEFSVFEFDCPAGLAFDGRWEVCVWPGSLPHGAPCSGSSEIAPVPKTRYACPQAAGYYADPENCRWFFACLDHGKSGLTAYEFRCPFGLVFDEKRLVCEWPWLVPTCKTGTGLEISSIEFYGGLAQASNDANGKITQFGIIQNQQPDNHIYENYDGLGTLGIIKLGGIQGNYNLIHGSGNGFGHFSQNINGLSEHGGNIELGSNLDLHDSSYALSNGNGKGSFLQGFDTLNRKQADGLSFGTIGTVINTVPVNIHTNEYNKGSLLSNSNKFESASAILRGQNTGFESTNQNHGTIYTSNPQINNGNIHHTNIAKGSSIDAVHGNIQAGNLFTNVDNSYDHITSKLQLDQLFGKEGSIGNFGFESHSGIGAGNAAYTTVQQHGHTGFSNAELKNADGINLDNENLKVNSNLGQFVHSTIQHYENNDKDSLVKIQETGPILENINQDYSSGGAATYFDIKQHENDGLVGKFGGATSYINLQHNTKGNQYQNDKTVISSGHLSGRDDISSIGFGGNSAHYAIQNHGFNGNSDNKFGSAHITDISNSKLGGSLTYSLHSQGDTENKNTLLGNQNYGSTGSKIVFSENNANIDHSINKGILLNQENINLEGVIDTSNIEAGNLYSYIQQNDNSKLDLSKTYSKTQENVAHVATGDISLHTNANNINLGINKVAFSTVQYHGNNGADEYKGKIFTTLNHEDSIGKIKLYENPQLQNGNIEYSTTQNHGNNNGKLFINSDSLIQNGVKSASSYSNIQHNIPSVDTKLIENTNGNAYSTINLENINTGVHLQTSGLNTDKQIPLLNSVPHVGGISYSSVQTHNAGQLKTNNFNVGNAFEISNSQVNNGYKTVHDNSHIKLNTYDSGVVSVTPITTYETKLEQGQNIAFSYVKNQGITKNNEHVALPVQHQSETPATINTAYSVQYHGSSPVTVDNLHKQEKIATYIQTPLIQETKLITPIRTNQEYYNNENNQNIPISTSSVIHHETSKGNINLHSNRNNKKINLKSGIEIIPSVTLTPIKSNIQTGFVEYHGNQGHTQNTQVENFEFSDKPSVIYENTAHLANHGVQTSNNEHFAAVIPTINTAAKSQQSTIVYHNNENKYQLKQEKIEQPVHVHEYYRNEDYVQSTPKSVSQIFVNTPTYVGEKIIKSQPSLSSVEYNTYYSSKAKEDISRQPIIQYEYNTDGNINKQQSVTVHGNTGYNSVQQKHLSNSQILVDTSAHTVQISTPKPFVPTPIYKTEYIISTPRPSFISTIAPIIKQTPRIIPKVVTVNKVIQPVVYTDHSSKSNVGSVQYYEHKQPATQHVDSNAGEYINRVQVHHTLPTVQKQNAHQAYNLYANGYETTGNVNYYQYGSGVKSNQHTSQITTHVGDKLNTEHALFDTPELQYNVPAPTSVHFGTKLLHNEGVAATGIAQPAYVYSESILSSPVQKYANFTTINYATNYAHSAPSTGVQHPVLTKYYQPQQYQQNLPVYESQFFEKSHEADHSAYVSKTIPTKSFTKITQPVVIAKEEISAVTQIPVQTYVESVTPKYETQFYGVKTQKIAQPVFTETYTPIVQKPKISLPQAILTPTVHYQNIKTEPVKVETYYNKINVPIQTEHVQPTIVESYNYDHPKVETNIKYESREYLPVEKSKIIPGTNQVFVTTPKYEIYQEFAQPKQTIELNKPVPAVVTETKYENSAYLSNFKHSSHQPTQLFVDQPKYEEYEHYSENPVISQIKSVPAVNYKLDYIISTPKPNFFSTIAPIIKQTPRIPTKIVTIKKYATNDYIASTPSTLVKPVALPSASFSYHNTKASNEKYLNQEQILLSQEPIVATTYKPEPASIGTFKYYDSRFDTKLSPDLVKSEIYTLSTSKPIVSKIYSLPPVSSSTFKYYDSRYDTKYAPNKYISEQDVVLSTTGKPALSLDYYEDNYGTKISEEKYLTNDEVYVSTEQPISSTIKTIPLPSASYNYDNRKNIKSTTGHYVTEDIQVSTLRPIVTSTYKPELETYSEELNVKQVTARPIARPSASFDYNIRYKTKSADAIYEQISTIKPILTSTAKTVPSGSFEYNYNTDSNTGGQYLIETTDISTKSPKVNYGSDYVITTYKPKVPTVTTIRPVVRKKILITTAAPDTYVNLEHDKYVTPAPAAAVKITPKPKGKTIVRVNDFHPFLTTKLGAQCTCVSNTVKLRNSKSKNREQTTDYEYNLSDNVPITKITSEGPASYDDYSEPGVYVVGNSDNFDYDYEPQRIATPEPETVVSTTNAIQPAPTPNYATRKVVTPVSVEIKAATAKTEERKAARTRGRQDNKTKEEKIADAVNEGLTLVKSAIKGYVKDAIQEEVHNLDRFGHGGWRSRDEKLQGSVDCQREGLFRHPTQCNKFYACRWDCDKQRYTLHVFNCPVHLTFDNTMGACNWPSKGPACSGNTLLPTI